MKIKRRGFIGRVLASLGVWKIAESKGLVEELNEFEYKKPDETERVLRDLANYYQPPKFSVNCVSTGIFFNAKGDSVRYIP